MNDKLVLTKASNNSYHVMVFLLKNNYCNHEIPPYRSELTAALCCKGRGLGAARPNPAP
jgi:hypothetical protein